MNKYCLSVISILLIIFSLSGSAFSQESEGEFEITRLSESIVFDGVPNDDAWKNKTPFPFIMYQPVHGKQTSEEIDVRIGFDDINLYVGASMYYSDISMIHAKGKKRDYAEQSCDWFGIHLDTYNDNQSSLVFYTNPNGIRSDASVMNNLKTFERDVNFNWNTYWEVKTQVDEKGWYAELKIPLSSLRYQTKDGNVSMGLILARFIPEKNEMDIFPNISPEYNLGTWKPSLAKDVVFRGLESRKPVYISPYILTGVGQEVKLNENGDKYLRETSPKIEAGIDFKVGLTNNLTMDITANTDFAQVEADDQQINLTRYSLFFPEKRVFFQEKSDAFDFPMGGSSNLFYSRRIGLYDDMPVRILGGARLTGRAGKWDLGFLDMQTQKITDLPSENFGVARIRRTVFNEYSYLGGMLTSKLGMDGNYNIASGVDGNIKIIGDDYFSFHIARTFDRNVKEYEYSLDPVRMQFVWDKRSEEGLAYDLTYTWTGKDFNPEMGFMRKNNYLGGYLMALYGWVPDEGSILLRHKFKTEWMNYYTTHSGGLLETFSIKTGWYFESREGLTGQIAHNYSYEYLVDTLEFSEDTRINPGTYNFHFISTEWTIPPSSPVIGAIKTESGTFYDGWKISATLMPIWSLGNSFDLSGTYRLDFVKFTQRDISFLNHIAGIRALWTFTTKISLSAFIQYNTSTEGILSNLRFRYNPREGVDFYLVYNEGLNADPYSQIPKLPISDSRTLMAKFTYTLGH